MYYQNDCQGSTNLLNIIGLKWGSLKSDRIRRRILKAALSNRTNLDAYQQKGIKFITSLTESLQLRTPHKYLFRVGEWERFEKLCGFISW